jgi:metallophosphoesterase superfamily enzyme
VLVVHKHLGSDSLQTWLVGHGHPTVRLGSSAGYRILQSRAAADA